MLFRSAHQVRFVQRAGKETVLPKVATVAAGPVVGERVFGVSVPQGMGERVLPLGDGNEMDVIGHQAIAQNACAGTRGG